MQITSRRTAHVRSTAPENIGLPEETRLTNRSGRTDERAGVALKQIIRDGEISRKITARVFVKISCGVHKRVEFQSRTVSRSMKSGAAGILTVRDLRHFAAAENDAI